MADNGERVPDETRPVIHFERITARTVVPACRLSQTLTPVQKKMVADNALSIAQAHFSDNECLVSGHLCR